MLTVVVAQRLGCRNRDVRAKMAELGVEPAYVLRDERGLVWRRAEIEKTLT
ncbi:hypothetical protein [Lichenifustis flavocetrariae]|uniref:Uncharacterized protein n=1 Tax=Lichenifustis flavocetrariae TaxID=2949735 RepID=A0AA42CRQ7_9HYPH|nr:hypothetical protein [Lichenifustis flavocetrariae]MCW6512737.1 hypothetical protein [Lichenifustis flavocetrariae]